jgi:hypothetical protein
MLLENSRQGLQLCFRPHLKQGMHTKLWAPKDAGVEIPKISKLQLGNPGTK